MKPERRKEILDALASPVCHCGKSKATKMSHCRQCYFSLPTEMRKALYCRFGAGYEEAYEETLLFLSGTP